MGGLRAGGTIVVHLGDGTADEPFDPLAHPSLAGLLDSSGARWCLLREPGPPSARDFGPELDLLVHADDLTALRTALAGRGFRRLPSWGRRPHSFFVGPPCEEAAGGLVKFDVVTAIAFGPLHELVTPLAGAVLDRRVVENGWWRPHPADRWWLLLLHALLDRDDVAPRHRAALAAGASPLRVDGDVSPVAALLPADLRAELERLVAAERWDELPSRAGAVRRASSRSLRGEAVARIRAGANRMARRASVVQRAITRPGVAVALIGPDGAGKSSTISALLEARTVDRHAYLGLYPKRAAGDRNGTVRVAGRMWREWLVVAWHRRRGRTVLLDRHPLEAAAAPAEGARGARSVKRRLRRWLLARCVPSPDLVVVLDAPAGVLRARKPEHPLAELESRRRRYLDLARRRDIEVVDATRPPEEVAARVSRLVQQARYERLRPCGSP